MAWTPESGSRSAARGPRPAARRSPVRLRTANREPRMLTRSAAGRQGGADAGERVAGLGAEGGDGADADDDDEGQHDRVLDGGRAVFGLDELHDALGELTHETTPVKRWCRSPGDQA